MDRFRAEANASGHVRVELLEKLLSGLACSRGATHFNVVATVANRNAEPIFDEFQVGVQMSTKQCNVLRVLRFKRKRRGYYVLPTVGLRRCRVNVQGLFGRSYNVWKGEDTELVTHVN